MNIDEEKQNRPVLIVRDLAKHGIPPDIVFESLLRRGVFKWLSVRQDLIRLKDVWKDEITGLNRKKTEREKGYLCAMENCRKQIRALCHSPRLRAPDNDLSARRFLSSFVGGQGTYK